jgi:hypothetical protein
LKNLDSRMRGNDAGRLEQIYPDRSVGLHTLGFVPYPNLRELALFMN